MDISLSEKVALVTGTGPNIGSGVALALAKYGARVACNDIRPEQAEAAFAAALESGRLSVDDWAPNYAGRHMYMGRNPMTGKDMFRNIKSLRYLW